MNKKILIIIIIVISILLGFYSYTFAENLEITRQKIDSQLIRAIKLFGYTVIMIFTIKEIIQQAQRGDVQGIGTTVVKYLIIYACLLGLPTMLRWVESFIEGLK